MGRGSGSESSSVVVVMVAAELVAAWFLSFLQAVFLSIPIVCLSSLVMWYPAVMCIAV